MNNHECKTRLCSRAQALCTWIAADGIEECRRTCGGHGYSRLSGLPTLFASYVQNVTWEGDNNVLCLQTARFLIKVRACVGACLSVSVRVWWVWVGRRNSLLLKDR